MLLLLAKGGVGHAAPTPNPAPAPTPATFNIAPAPAWVKKIDFAARRKPDDDGGGISYLVIDRQENIAYQTAFYHEARQITSDNGVQNGASVTASFDPAYQALTFHFLEIIREGKRVNRLDRSQIKLFQREKDMESFLYDGTYTAQCELEDIRVGDIIEFGFSIRGSNPVKNGRYSRSVYTDWSFPVDRVVTRFVFPEHRKLKFLTKNRPLKPIVTSGNGTTEWLSDQTSVPARRTDSDVPLDYDPNGWVQVSEYENWKAVVDWALPLFRPEASASPELAGEVAKLREIHDPQTRVLTALQLVQEKVRYLGIESGVGSHRPTAPSEVLRRRFGDCKDKALLLATLLSQSGIEAYPALVHTVFRGTVDEHLPSPDDFDHAIVQVRIGDKIHWLDPTRSSQRGPLSELYVRDLKRALVLRRGTEALTGYSPPPGSMPRRTVTENYQVPAPGGTGELEVITESHGLSAERTRSRFHENGREKIEKEYLQYYTRSFAKATLKKSLIYEEIPETNGCRTREFYSIPEIWTKSDEENEYELNLYPGDIAEAMGYPGPSQRDDPLALNYPAKVKQVIHARMFDAWSLNAKNQSVKNAFFRFSDEAIVRGRDVTIVYDYEALADRVTAADLRTYNAALSKHRDGLRYKLTFHKLDESVDFQKWMGRVNWPIAFLTGAVATLAMVLCALLFHFTRLALPLPPPANVPPQHHGLGGWLILVGIHHLVRPFYLLAGLWTLVPTIFDLEIWRTVTEPGRAQFHPYYKPLLLFELWFNLLSFIFSGALILFFFRKRAAWRWLYPAFLLFLLAGVAADTYFARGIPAASHDMKGLGQVIGAVVVWVPYCFISKRVRATFRR